MFVPFKDEDGKLALRPALIGFIKNDACRKISMLLIWPLTVAVTFALNYLLVFLGFLLEVVRLTIKHVKMLKYMPWQSPVWNNPRNK